MFHTSPSGGLTTSVLVVSKLDKLTDSWKVQLSSLTATLSTATKNARDDQIIFPSLEIVLE